MSEHVDVDYAEHLKLLGERIRKIRTERGLSVRDMVVRHDYHDAQWRRFEKGASLTVPSLIRIAKALGVSLSILLDGIGDFPAPPVKTSKLKKTK
jgi:transcriptional regulator with XRE-family HTH domain